MPLLMPISAVMVTDGVLDTTHTVFSKVLPWVLPLDLTTPSTCRGTANGLTDDCVSGGSRRAGGRGERLTLNTLPECQNIQCLSGLEV